MSDFLNLDLCHEVSMGEGVTVLVVDLPVDYRHDIFSQEGFESITDENCIRIQCDYDTLEVTGIVNVDDSPYTE